MTWSNLHKFRVGFYELIFDKRKEVQAEPESSFKFYIFYILHRSCLLLRYQVNTVLARRDYIAVKRCLETVLDRRYGAVTGLKPCRLLREYLIPRW